MLINQAFLLFNYCTLCINISVFNDCLLTLTVMFSMTVYFWGLLYLHWLTISNEYPVSNPILLRMTALFTKKAYKPSVSFNSFCTLNYCTSLTTCYQWWSTFEDHCIYITDYFKCLSSFKSNIVKNDSSLNEECLSTKRFFFSITVLCALTSVFSMIVSLHLSTYIDCNDSFFQWWSTFEDCTLFVFNDLSTYWLFQMSTFEYPVKNPILLRMTALLTKNAYQPSVSSFQLLYSVH